VNHGSIPQNFFKDSDHSHSLLTLSLSKDTHETFVMTSIEAKDDWRQRQERQSAETGTGGDDENNKKDSDDDDDDDDDETQGNDDDDQVATTAKTTTIKLNSGGP